MKFYHKLTYPEKFKRTLYAGIPLLLVSSIIIFILAPTTAEKITIPAILLVIWLIQLMYTFQKSKKQSNENL